jgi:hypothetical protein
MLMWIMLIFTDHNARRDRRQQQGQLANDTRPAGKFNFVFIFDVLFFIFKFLFYSTVYLLVTIFYSTVYLLVTIIFKNMYINFTFHGCSLLLVFSERQLCLYLQISALPDVVTSTVAGPSTLVPVVTCGPPRKCMVIVIRLT